MLKLALVLAIAIAQVGCYYEAGDRYKSTDLPIEARERFERAKRDLLKIEDLKIGDGPVAAWNRQLTFDMEVRYLNGTVAYKGPAYIFFGSYGDGGNTDKNHLTSDQIGILLGLNGMAVGGRRRISIDRRLVCESIPDDAPLAKCLIVGSSSIHGSQIFKQNLIVETTLKEACVPVKLEANIWYIGVNMDVWCRNEDTPRLDPTLPIWHVY